MHTYSMFLRVLYANQCQSVTYVILTALIQRSHWFTRGQIVKTLWRQWSLEGVHLRVPYLACGYPCWVHAASVLEDQRSFGSPRGHAVETFGARYLKKGNSDDFLFGMWMPFAGDELRAKCHICRGLTVATVSYKWIICLGNFVESHPWHVITPYLIESFFWQTATRQ